MTYERFIAIGNATKDAEFRKAAKGETTFATFSVAVNKGEGKTSFYPVVVFGPTAEAASQAIKKGDKVLVEGSLNMRTYRTKEGEPRTEVQVLADLWRKL